MNKVFALLVLLGVVPPLLCVAQNDANPIVRWHFAGRAALAQGTNATRLKAIEALAVTAGLRAQIATNLARAPRKFWDKELAAGTPDGAALLRPLFEDLLVAESFGEVRGPLGRTETALAIELTDAHAAVWSTNLWQLATAWKLGQPRPDAAGGWEVSRAAEPKLFHFTRAGKWVVLGLASDKAKSAASWLEQIKSAGRPTPAEDELFALQLDSPVFGNWFPLFKELAVPPFEAAFRGRGENVRLEAKLKYPQPLGWKYEPWRIPTNMIGEPLSSFTVARGIAPLAGRLVDFAALKTGPAPNQVCFWGSTNDPCRVYFTYPVDSAHAVMQQTAISFPGYIEKALGQHMGDFFYASNRNMFIWGSLPFIQPYLQGVTNGGTSFLHGGLFPLPPKQTPVPPDLFAQLGQRTNLLYYDWEFTPFRVIHGNQLYQILNIASRRMLQPQTTPCKTWVSNMVQELAKDPSNPSQSVTEITQTAPNELTLTRKSHLGLTGFEIATLSAWLDSPGFPFRYEPPKVIRMPSGTNAAASATNKLPAQKR